MQKIIAIAADYQHLRNYCKDKGMNLSRFVHATKIEKMQGLRRGYSYIVVSEPYDYNLWHKMQTEFRAKGAIRLPLNINEWSLMDFA